MFESLPVATHNLTGNKETIELWPIPATQHMNWKSEEEIQRITLYNATGIPVKEINPGDTQADLTFLMPGSYYFVFSTGKKLISKKIIKL